MKVAFVTLGCKVNQYDVARLKALLHAKGYKICNDAGNADLWIISTCTVTASTDAQSRHEVRRAVKKAHGSPVIVTGCGAEIAPEMFEQIPGVRKVVKLSEFNRLPQIVDAILKGEENTGAFEADNKEETIAAYYPNRTRAFVKIQDGCDERCSYCIIRIARGPSRSKTEEEVIGEIKKLAERGHKEIVLTGVNIGLYGRDLTPPSSLPRLLRKVVSEEIVPRIRLSSIEPQGINGDIISLLADGLICEHLHIPIQSGDDMILKNMNRPYSAADLEKMLEKISKKVQHIAIGLDIIVGFPGEDDASYERTYKLIESLPVAYLHVFPFSPRPGTPAASMPGRPHPRVVKERAQRLRDLGAIKKKKFYEENIGRIAEVLLESKREPATGRLLGFTRNYVKVAVKASKEFENKEIRAKLLKLEGKYVVAETVR